MSAHSTELLRHPPSQELLIQDETDAAAAGAATRGARRHKRWAPKTRSGCQTCRERRVKCDETKPTCKRCLAVGRICGGYRIEGVNKVQSPTLDIVYDGFQDRQPWRQANYHAREHGLSRDVLPPDWEFIEGFRYFVDIVVAAHNESKLADSDYDAQHAATAQVTAKDSFLMTIFAHRISALARSQHALPRPNEPASVSHLWARFYHYMMLAIQDINRHINGGSPPKAALYRIVDIMGVELRVMSPMWRAHIEGFGALVRKYGGVRKVLGPRDGTSPLLALQVILIYTVMANAVSPIENQISACSDWSTEELYDVYSSNLYSDMPCPTDLFVDIIRITRLRLLYAAGASVSKVVLPVAREIFRDIQGFLPDNWNESYPLPKSTKRALIGRIFKSAVDLYCLLSMPETATVFTSDSENSDSTPEADPILACRRDLMESITMAMNDLPSKVPLSWPLTILGVACVNGSSEEKETIESYFRGIIDTAFIESGPAQGLAKVKKFWESGKTGWEDCFEEPCTVLA